MARSKVRLDLRGLEQVAKSSQVRNEVEALAERVADIARGSGVMVEGVPGDTSLPVEVYHGDAQGMRVGRARSAVVLAHPAGEAVQAKHGTLTKAAAQAGLKVQSR